MGWLASGIVFLTVLYLLYILFLLSQLYERPFTIVNGTEEFISVVIPFRNEEANLKKLIDSLTAQHYSAFEVLLIDDHSTDNSLSLAHSLCELTTNYNVFSLNKAQGKKAAQQVGVLKAKGAIVAFTDADCQPEQNWLQAINHTFQSDKEVVFYMGQLKLLPGISYPSLFFEIEFYSLLFVGMAMAKIGLPVYCNAANMAVRKEVYTSYIKVRKSKSASGDDVFLLHHIKKEFGSKTIRTGNNTLSSVRTGVPDSFTAFFKQRMRWGAKSIYYRDTITLLLAFSMALVNGSVAAGVIISVVMLAPEFLLPFIIKLIADLLFFNRGLQVVNRYEIVKYIPLFELLYLIYLPLTGLVSVLVPVKWKGRK